MATVKISQLPALTGANTAATDVIPIVDVSGNITNKITREEFFKNIQSNVGIGTTSPDARLTISSSGVNGLNLAVDQGNSLLSSRLMLSNGTAGQTTLLVNNSGGLAIHTGATPNSSSGTERMRIDSTGRVGIGTTSMFYDLDVRNAAASATISVQAATGNAVFRASSLSSGTARLDLVSSPGTQSITGGVGSVNNMVFSVNATERMRIDASGNVGIGTSSVSYRLHLNNASAVDIETGVTNSAGTSRFGTRGSGNAFAGAFTAGKSLELWSAGSQAATIDASGNLGLGVTPSAWSAGVFQAFELTNGVSLASYKVDTTPIMTLSSNAWYNGATGNWIYKNSKPSAKYEQNQGLHSWSIAPSGTAGGTITFTQAMTLDASGNLGIGTSSPSVKLHVASSGNVEQYLASGTNSSTARLYFINNTANSSIGCTSAGNEIAFYTGATERMRIDSSGNVGIGNTAPVVPLHVTGDTMTTGIVYINQPTQTSKAAAATLTIAELETGIIQYTGAAATLTLPTGTLIEGGLPATFPVNMGFDFSVINTGSGIATMGTSTGLTLVGAMTVAVGASGCFRVRKTALNTYTIYRIS